PTRTRSKQPWPTDQDEAHQPTKPRPDPRSNAVTAPERSFFRRMVLSSPHAILPVALGTVKQIPTPGKRPGADGPGYGRLSGPPAQGGEAQAEGAAAGRSARLPGGSQKGPAVRVLPHRPGLRGPAR